MSPKKKQKNLTVNLDNFTEGGPNVGDAQEIGSPRSLLVIERLGYKASEVSYGDFSHFMVVFLTFIGH